MDNIVEVQHLPKAKELILLAEGYKLSNVEIVEKFTIQQIEHAYNGIGPDRFPKLLRDALCILNPVILPAVLIHDLEFTLGGTIEDFHAANSNLRSNGKLIIRAHYGILNPFRYILSHRMTVFYRLCEKFGLVGWNLKTDSKL